MLSIRRALIVSAFATLTVAVVSQEPVQQAQPPAASQSVAPLPSPDATPKSLSSSLGVYVFATNGHAPDLQSKDEGSCFSWAKGQTGIDPTAPPPPTQAATATQQTAPDPSKGSGAKGAAGGEQEQAQQQQAQAQVQQQAQAQATAQEDDRKSTYNKAFSACMEGKGYTVK